MKAVMPRNFAVLCLLPILVLLSACATTLAPAYDQAVVDGLISTNRQLMEYFASVSSGTEKETFAERRKSYNKLIGSLDALVIQARARPTPTNKASDKVNAYLASRGVPNLEDDETPTATALQKMSATVTKMRNTDRKQGVTPLEVQAFRGQVVIYMDQALTYESFLKR